MQTGSGQQLSQSVSKWICTRYLTIIIGCEDGVDAYLISRVPIWVWCKFASGRADNLTA